jgi:hypothetical protein
MAMDSARFGVEQEQGETLLVLEFNLSMALMERRTVLLAECLDSHHAL